jgi:hypothetical protein
MPHKHELERVSRSCAEALTRRVMTSLFIPHFCSQSPQHANIDADPQRARALRRCLLCSTITQAHDHPLLRLLR